MKKLTRSVAYSGDLESTITYRPVDAATNPSIIYAAANKGKYRLFASRAALIAQVLSTDPGQ